MASSLARRLTIAVSTCLVGFGLGVGGAASVETAARAAQGSPGVAPRVAPAPPVAPGIGASSVADRRDRFIPALRALPSTATPTGTWRPLGPAPIGPPYLVSGGFYGGVNSGRITGVAVIPSGAHAGRVVAGSAGGGIWTSDDNGKIWTPRSDQAPSLAIGAVADDPSTPDHLIAGMGEANQSADSYPGFGILSSVNGGTTWTAQDPGNVFFGLHVAQVAIDPTSSTHMMAATDGGLFVTTNGGTTWAKPTGASYAAVDGSIDGVVINPTTPATVYLSGGAKTVAKSTNGGVTWAAANSGITAPDPGAFPFTALAIARSSPTTLYASVGTNAHPVKLYKSTNGGGSWSAVTAAPDYTGAAFAYGGGTDEQGWYDNVVAIDPVNASHVLAGGIAVVETVDGGSHWTNPNGQPFFGGGTNRFHPDAHALAFRPDHKIWVGDDGGVFLYDPTAKTVANANGNLNITQFYFGFNEVGGSVLAGSQDNGSSRTASGSVAAWTGIWSGDGGPSAITPNHTQTQFMEANQRLNMTTDAFASEFSPKDITPPAVGLFTPPMIVVANTVDPSNPTVFYGGPDLYRTTNPTAATPTWTKVTSVGGGAFVSALAASPTNSQVIYAGFTNGTIQVSTDGGSTFTSLAAQPFAFTFVTGLSVNPTNPRSVTASVSWRDTRNFVTAPHVAQYSYSATPGSGTWTTITGNLPPNAAVSRVVYDNGALVAATDSGVYATGAPSGASTAWSLVGTGLPAVQVQDLYVDPTSGDLYAVTHGRGAWKLPKAATLSISTTSMANGTVGTAYGQAVVATGGTTAYHWSISVGSLPAGLSLSATTGKITGTPTAAGKASFTVKVTDSGVPSPQQATKALSITVLAPPVPTEADVSSWRWRR